MKKIIRIASVIALLGVSLLYVGCTKDFSADLAKTNSEVAAQASKVAALEATVGTLNSTVENLKTTKADAAAVNALQADLEKKIDVLAAALEQTALLAKDAKADAEAVAADLEVEKAKLDSIILVVDTLAIKSDSLRKDVDSLYKNSASMANDIKALTGRVEGLESRITSLVAIPSLTEEIVEYDIDTIVPAGAKPKSIDAAIFTAKFAVTPKDAKIDTSNLSLVLKEGLTKGNAHKSIDSVYKVTSAVFENGILTVSTKVGEAIRNFRDLGANSIYYSLCFNGKDANGTEYSKFSEFVAAKVTKRGEESLRDVVKFVYEGEAFDNKIFADTVSYAKDSTVFTTSLNGYGKVMAEINGAFITLDEFATILGTKASKFVIDTVVTTQDSILTKYKSSRRNKYASATDPGATWPGDDFNSDKPGYQEFLYWFPSGKASAIGNGINQKTKTIFYKKKVTDNHYYGNRTTVTTEIKAGRDDNNTVATLTDNLYIGAKNKGTFNLGTSTEDWYYDFAVSAIKDSFVVKNADAAEALKDSVLRTANKDGFFAVKAEKNTENVIVKVSDVKYAKVAADTTYNVNWATSTDIRKKADSTFLAVNWNLKVGPRPADPATIKYAIDTTVRGTKSITKKFDTFANSVAAIKALNNHAAFDEPVIKSITINGKALDLTKSDASKRFEFKSVKEGVVTFLNAVEGTTVVVATADCAGITFTYEFTLNLTKGATPTFKALTAYLKVEGDKSFSAEIAAPKIDTTTNKGSQGKYVEALKTMKFNQYFVVDTTNAALAGLYATFGTPDTTGHKQYFVEKGGELKVNADKVTFGDGAFAWDQYDSLTTNVVAYLVYKPEQVADTIDQVNIKFWTADPIKSVAHVDSTVKHNNTAGDKIDLKGLFTMKDFVDSTVWAGGKAVANRTYEYGQEIKFAQDEKKWTISGGTFSKGSLKLTESVLTLDAEGAEIVNPITVEIPFTVVETLDPFGVAAADRQGTVKVTFTSAK